MTPVRLQLSRAKGFNLQEASRLRNGLEAVNVARPSKWGNPFILGEPSGVFPEDMGHRGAAEVLIPALSIEQVIEFYRNAVTGFISPEMYPNGHDWRSTFLKKTNNWWPIDAARSMLRGKNLACWCKSGMPCHADVLLELANHPPRKDSLHTDTIPNKNGET